MDRKISIRFYKDYEVRAIWDEEGSKWWFSVVDIVGAITKSTNPNNYWKVFKSRLKKSAPELVTKCNQLKLISSDGKRYSTDTLDYEGIQELTIKMKATDFLDWFTYSDNTIDGQSKKKAYTFWESNLIGEKEIGTIKALQKIHGYIFGGLYDFAGQIRSKNISKGGFIFAPYQHFHITLPTIERMPETTFDEIIDKYVEMNVAHPFMEGNGRATRIWLDLIFKRRLKKCVDWSIIGKNDYLNAMIISPTDSSGIKKLLKKALTSKINDMEIFMKGIDYSYYYEQEE